MAEANSPSENQLLWICGTCGHKTGGPLPQPALCREPSCPASSLHSGGRFGGVLKALPRETDTPLMAEMRRSAPDHRYENDDQIIDGWVRTAELGMQLPTWELKWFAKVFQEQRQRLVAMLHGGDCK